MNQIVTTFAGRRKWILLAGGLAITIVSVINFPRINERELPSGNNSQPAARKQLQPLPPSQAYRQPVPESANSSEAVIVVQQDRSQEISRLLKQATTDYETRRFDQSMIRAQQALRLEPDNVDALEMKIRSRNAWEDEDTSDFKLLDQANSYFVKGQFDGAALLYNRYTDAHPESRPSILPQILKSYYNLGMIAMRQKRFDVAAEYFNQNLLLAESHAPSREALTLAQHYIKEPPPDSDFELPSLMR